MREKDLMPSRPAGQPMIIQPPAATDTISRSTNHRIAFIVKILSFKTVFGIFYRRRPSPSNSFPQDIDQPGGFFDNTDEDGNRLFHENPVRQTLTPLWNEIGVG
jgi:hypothetical protein